MKKKVVKGVDSLVTSKRIINSNILIFTCLNVCVVAIIMWGIDLCVCGVASVSWVSLSIVGDVTLVSSPLTSPVGPGQ